MNERDTARRASIQIETGTALASDETSRETFLDAIEQSVDPALFQGAFASNVWGGRFEIERLLKKGGQGTTFTGTDRKTGAAVVVKVLDLKHTKDWKRIELFDREIKTLKRLNIAGLPRFVDVIDEPSTGAKALVMTKIPGESLDDVVKADGPMGESELWRVLVDATGILTKLHESNPALVHRDIKPQNLIKMPNGDYAVVDLGGIGHVRHEGGSTVVGTFGYMAPEQIYGASSPRLDVFALGATMMHLATGIEPEDLPRRGLTIDVDKAAPHLSASLRKILAHMVAAEPDARPEDARAVTKLLTEMVQRRSDGDDDERSSATTDAVFRDSDVTLAHHTLTGVIALVIGILGTVATVAIGEVLLPVLTALVAAFSHGEQKARVLRFQGNLSTGTKLARDGFGKSIERGVRTLQEADVRDKRRRMQMKKDKRAAKERERSFRRESKAQERRRR